ncbi:DUF1707 and DUF4190 domain-containing protein [Nocardia sp. CA-129566]|uniref:DUF1707 and DUF4190 domain-containing protein n=1 Tax=Nocardia sp. CA-129566 TaxID=3239976 RepID=UPI003D98F541
MDPFIATPNLRAADADREEVVDALKHNFQLGRLDADELSDRIGQALCARTFGDLAVAMEGLPPIQRAVGQPVYRPYPRAVNRSNPLAIASLVLGLLGVCCGLSAPLALILGIVGLTEERKNPDPRPATAIAGITIAVTFGIVWLIVWANALS